MAEAAKGAAVERTTSGTALEATAALLLATAVADALGSQSVSLLLFVLAVPVAAVTGLAALARVIDDDEGRVAAVLAAVLLAVVLFGAAVRSPAIAEPGVPPAATVALVAAFVVLLAQALLALAERPARSQVAEDVGGDGPLLPLDPDFTYLVDGRIAETLEGARAD